MNVGIVCIIMIKFFALLVKEMMTKWKGFKMQHGKTLRLQKRAGARP